MAGPPGPGQVFPVCGSVEWPALVLGDRLPTAPQRPCTRPTHGLVRPSAAPCRPMATAAHQPSAATTVVDGCCGSPCAGRRGRPECRRFGLSVAQLRGVRSPNWLRRSFPSGICRPWLRHTTRRHRGICHQVISAPSAVILRQLSRRAASWPAPCRHSPTAISQPRTPTRSALRLRPRSAHSHFHPRRSSSSYELGRVSAAVAAVAVVVVVVVVMINGCCSYPGAGRRGRPECRRFSQSVARRRAERLADWRRPVVRLRPDGCRPGGRRRASRSLCAATMGDLNDGRRSRVRRLRWHRQGFAFCRRSCSGRHFSRGQGVHCAFLHGWPLREQNDSKTSVIVYLPTFLADLQDVVDLHLA